MDSTRFVIVDDDYGICQVLSNIIEDNDLGDVVDTVMMGEEGADLIVKYRPDIVFVDLLLPDIDGIEIVKRVKRKNKDIDFIMISQVSDVDMISDAYDHGIEFYINKPINVVEVVSVTKKVIKSQHNRRVIETIGNTIGTTVKNQSIPVEVGLSNIYESNTKAKINLIFAELGIISERGCSDLSRLVEIICEDKREKNKSASGYSVGNLYKQISDEYNDEKNRKNLSDKAIEQRIRRTIQSAYLNIVNIGTEDFGNYKFEKYASTLFDFREVMKGIDFVRKGKSMKGKVSIKAFVSGIVSFIDHE